MKFAVALCLALIAGTASAGQRIDEETARTLIRIAFNHPDASFKIIRVSVCDDRRFMWFYSPAVLDLGHWNIPFRAPFVVDVRTGATFYPGEGRFDPYSFHNPELAKYRRQHHLSGRFLGRPNGASCPEAHAEPGALTKGPRLPAPLE